MKDINIDSDSKVISIAREHFYQGNNKAVLLIHGFTGSPHNMKYLAKRIYRETNFTVHVPRLPGHGTNSKDFRQSNARDWLRKVYDSYINLKNKYTTVYVGGLSMGGLLAILTTARFYTEKLFLIAPALYAHNKLLPLTNILKYVVPVMKDNLAPNPQKFESQDELKLFNNYWKNHYTEQVAELHKLMRLSRKKLTEINAKTLILTSRNDEQVPMKAAYTINKKISTENKKLVIFEDSPHVINNGPEKEACAEYIINFLLE